MNQHRQLALAEQVGLDTRPDFDPYEVPGGRDRDTRVAMTYGGHVSPTDQSYWSRPKIRPVPPPGYYAEAAKGHQQGVLSGMQMSVQDHLNALKTHTGAEDVSLIDHNVGGGVQHELSVYGKGNEPSYLGWEGTEPSEGSQPGEVAMIRSQSPGHGSAMFNTATRIAAEHPSEVSMPMHSAARSAEGREWVPKMQQRAGERVW